MEFLAILKRVNALIFLVSMAGAVVVLIILAIQYFIVSKDISKSKNLLLSVLAGLILLSTAAIIPTLLLSFLKEVPGSELRNVDFPTGSEPPVITFDDRDGGGGGGTGRDNGGDSKKRGLLPLSARAVRVASRSTAAAENRSSQIVRISWSKPTGVTLHQTRPYRIYWPDNTTGATSVDEVYFDEYGGARSYTVEAFAPNGTTVAKGTVSIPSTR